MTHVQRGATIASTPFLLTFRCRNAGFNTNYLGELVSTGIYAVVLVVAGKEALKPESRVCIGDVVLALSTLRNFSGSINALCNRLRKVGGLYPSHVLAPLLLLPLFVVVPCFGGCWLAGRFTR